MGQKVAGTKKPATEVKQVLPAYTINEMQVENRKSWKTGKGMGVEFGGKDYLENTMFLVLGD